MNKFQVKFIVQFIIDVLVLGILLELVSHVLIATVAKSTSASWTALCYIIVLIEGLFNTLAIIMAVFLTQNAFSKKDMKVLDKIKNFSESAKEYGNIPLEPWDLSVTDYGQDYLIS